MNNYAPKSQDSYLSFIPISSHSS